MSDQEKKHELAKKIGKGKADFIRHLGTYAIVMAVLAVINNVTNPGGSQWWLWPAGIWGIFVVVNFLTAFVFRAGTFEKLEKRYTQQELDKMERDE
jgi:hypothetical protein